MLNFSSFSKFIPRITEYDIEGQRSMESKDKVDDEGKMKRDTNHKFINK